MVCAWVSTSVEEAMLVHECQPLKYLVHYISYGGLGKVPVSRAHELIEVAVHKFEDEEELIVLANDFLQLDDIRVVEFLRFIY